MPPPEALDPFKLPLSLDGGDLFGPDLESSIQRQNINVTTATARARQVRVLQYDVYRGLRLALRND
jgi:hypothetical protein